MCFSLAHVWGFRLWSSRCDLISCVAYTCLLRIYASTIVVKTFLPPADRHIGLAAGVSWCPHPNPLVFLSSHPSFTSSVPSVSYSDKVATDTSFRQWLFVLRLRLALRVRVEWCTEITPLEITPPRRKPGQVRTFETPPPLLSTLSGAKFHNFSISFSHNM